MKFKFFFPIIFVFFNVAVQGEQNYNIVKCYNLLPSNYYLDKESTLLKHKIYKLFLNKNRWVAKSLDSGLIYPTINIRNGYLDIKDIIGKGFLISIEHEAGLFKDNNNRITICLSVNHIFTLGNEHYLKCYRLISDKFTDVTNFIVPKVDYNLFLKKKYNKIKLNALDQVISKYYIICKVPQIGTRLKFYIDKKIKYTVDFQDSEKNRKFVQEFIDNLTFKVIEFEWNKKTGKFKLVQ